MKRLVVAMMTIVFFAVPVTARAAQSDASETASDALDFVGEVAEAFGYKEGLQLDGVVFRGTYQVP